MESLWFLMLLIIPGAILFLYIYVLVFKQIKNSKVSHIVPLATKLLDPIVEFVFLLPWGVFRMLERSQTIFVKRIPVHQVRDIYIWREDRTKLRMRVYHPHDGDNLPILVNFHGGGFAIGSIDTVDKSMRELCRRIGCVLISVDYRLSPEFPFPHGFNDAYLATKWIYNNARTLRGNPDQLVVMGDSAGGNFAAGVALQNSENGGKDFRLAHQVLIYPSTDLRPTSKRPSKKEFFYGWFYSTRHSRRFRLAYMQDIDRDSLQYQASPFVYEGDMRYVPGAFVLVAQLDPLRDEGFDYCQKLRDNNIPVKVNTYAATHGFFDMKMKEATRAHDDIVQVLRDLFYGSDKSDNYRIY
eukprot:Phypoly_transcript_12010.p1 GENE.Phypoly_transcript_12010~~Phypoly_transcript_12010.p1  ORF type:complete len:354 (+),score=24.74 Phypoly_transcript_12010:36-1097(+)